MTLPEANAPPAANEANQPAQKSAESAAILPATGTASGPPSKEAAATERHEDSAQEQLTEGSATDATPKSAPEPNPPATAHNATHNDNAAAKDTKSGDIEMNDVEQAEVKPTPSEPQPQLTASPGEAKDHDSKSKTEPSEIAVRESPAKGNDSAEATVPHEKSSATDEKQVAQQKVDSTSREKVSVEAGLEHPAPENTKTKPSIPMETTEQEAPAAADEQSSAPPSNDAPAPEPMDGVTVPEQEAKTAGPSPEQMNDTKASVHESAVTDAVVDKEKRTLDEKQDANSISVAKIEAAENPVKEPPAKEKGKTGDVEPSVKGGSEGQKDLTEATDIESKPTEDVASMEKQEEEATVKEAEDRGEEEPQSGQHEHEGEERSGEIEETARGEEEPSVENSIQQKDIEKQEDPADGNNKKEDVLQAQDTKQDNEAQADLVEPEPMETEEANEDADEDDLQPARKRPRRSSSRASVQPRPTRARASSRSGSSSKAAPKSPVEQQDSSEGIYISKKEEQSNDPEQMEEVDNENSDVPRPKMTPDGLQMVVGDSFFVTFDQLNPVKQKRMRDKKLKPIEELTFEDVHSYNRDQLRCYCFIYSTPRKKKIEMEADMARFVSLWNEGRPGFVLAEYVPNNPRGSSALSTSIIDGSFVREASEGAGTSGTELPTRSTRRSSAAGQRSLGRQGSSGRDITNEQNESDEKGMDSLTGRNAARTPSRAAAKTSTRAAAKVISKPPLLGQTPISAKRPPTRPNPVGNTPIPIQPNIAVRQGSVESSAMGRDASLKVPASGSAGLSPAQHGQIVPQLQGSGAGSTPSRSNGTNVAKPIKGPVPIQPMPKGLGTSFKQKVHARTAGAKFKAAYNGAGPAIVNIIENAAAYFEGKDTPEVISDQAKSYERYQFNVDLLSEIFDGPREDAENGSLENGPEEPKEEEIKNSVFQDVAKRMRTRNSMELSAELRSMEQSYRQLEAETKVVERTNMRMFQRLERAETEAEIEAVKRDFEKEHKVSFEDGPPALVRRKLDKSLPPLVMSDEQCHILRFKMS